MNGGICMKTTYTEQADTSKQIDNSAQKKSMKHLWTVEPTNPLRITSTQSILMIRTAQPFGFVNAWSTSRALLMFSALATHSTKLRTPTAIFPAPAVCLPTRSIVGQGNISQSVQILATWSPSTCIRRFRLQTGKWKLPQKLRPSLPSSSLGSR